MENSYKFFENRACKYYPCHEEIQEMNCLFCYCPLYARATCPGTYQWLEVNGAKIKDCTGCTFPHEAENYETIIAILSKT